MEKQSLKKCGIIMPIAAMPGYTSEHWAEVKSIIVEATKLVEEIEFKAEIVSDSDGEIDVIHKRIVQNIYNADIVVCDMSGRNPNVMFELGMRLTFDKPTIIIKDDETEFIFDTGSIEHLTYPKDLRFSKVVSFKKELARRIKITYEKSQSDPAFSTFLGNFGEFKVPSLNQTTVTDVNQFILEELGILRSELSSYKKEIAVTKNSKKNESFASRTRYLSELKKVLERYVKETRDYDDAEIVYIKEEFVMYLELNGLDRDKLTRSAFINLINEAQKNVLPF